jgi:tight adherence protein C
MSTVGVLAVLAVVTVAGLALIAAAWLQPAPTLARTLQHLQRRGSDVEVDLLGQRAVGPSRPAVVDRCLGSLGEWLGEQRGVLPDRTQLRVLGRSVEQHVLYLVTSVLIGLVLPALTLWALQQAGVIGLGWYAPLAAGLLVAVLAPLIVHSTSVERANAIRGDLRYQVSAYLDVVTMLLAGNSGYEGALEQAARAGDGRLFAELRRRMREAGARGSSLTDALHRAGVELGIDELEQIAATAALSAAEGAPVARTLAAKCATMRSALATEQETEARLRTSRLTAPIVGMALIFMALVIYPALTFS